MSQYPNDNEIFDNFDQFTQQQVKRGNHERIT